MKFRYGLAFSAILFAQALIPFWGQAQPTTISRSLNVVRVWNSPGVWANDFHIDFIARDLEGNFLDEADLDPFGYFDSLGAIRTVTFDPATRRLSITWTFPARCIPDPINPALFGFTVFGGVRYEIVDWYWTYDGVRVQSYPDVWQDWVKFNGQLQDVIVPRPVVLPPWNPPWPPQPPAPSAVTLLRTYTDPGLPPPAGPITISQLASAAQPQAPYVNDPLPVDISQYTPVVAQWPWPGVDPTYYMYYTVSAEMNEPIAGFQNAVLLAEQPVNDTPQPVPQPTDAFPPISGIYTSATATAFSQGMTWIRNFTVSSIAGSSGLPALAGEAVIQAFSAQASFELSQDGGNTWLAVTAPQSGTARAAVAGDGGGGTRSFDTEMLQLDISGGSLPANVRFRESPSRPSRGGLAATADGGGYQIDSFFDIFTEVSTDGGASWAPALAPVRVRLNPPPSVVVSLNRSLNVVRVWTGQGVWANDFHIEFEARDAAGLRMLDLDDLDPFGYFDDVFVTNRVVTFDALANRVSITWYFPDVCFPGAFMPAFFGFTLFGGVRFQAVDWYWTYNGERIINYQDVWQDWIKNPLTLQLEDTIVPRPMPIPPPPPGPPAPVTYLSRVTGSQTAPVAIADVVATAVPPNTVYPDVGLVPVTELVPVTYAWPWPGVDPTYYMYYDVLDGEAQAIAGFQNACILTPLPEAGASAPVEAPTAAFPTPDGVYAAAAPVTFGPEAVMADLAITLTGPGSELPPTGDASLHTVEALMVFDLGVGAAPPTPARLSVRPTLRVADAGGGSGGRTLDTEVVGLDCDEDLSNPGLRLRESPSRASLGRSVVQPLPTGRFQIDSFFDVFLEVSLDNGATWTPADAPARVVLTLPPPPPLRVTLNRSLNTVRVWNPPGMIANDFHVDFIARDLNGGYVDVNDLDPFGYVGSIATNRIVTVDPALKRVSITWQFADICVTSNAPAFFGFTVFGGVRYEAVDWYWTRDGVRIWSYEDVWQDWIKFNGNLRDVIAWRTPVIPPPILPTPVRSVSRVVGRWAEPIAAEVLAALVQPPGAVWPDPGPVVIGPTVTNIVAEWAWPGIDPTYFVFYDLLDGAGAPVAGFQNACTLVEQPLSGGELPQFAATDLFPPPTLSFSDSAAPAPIPFEGYDLVRNFTVSCFSSAEALPGPGEASIRDCSATAQCDISFGPDWWRRLGSSGNARMTIRAAYASSESGTTAFDTEMLALQVDGSPLAPGLRLRESPSKPSLGRTAVTPVADGYMIDSFFDVWLEVSSNGGASWTPADRAMRVAVQTIAPEAVVSDTRFAPDNSEYVGREERFAVFGKVARLRNFRHSHFSHACALPPQGPARQHAWIGRADFELSEDGGMSWTPLWATCRGTFDLEHMAESAGAAVHKTAFRSLELYGGSMPSALRMRLLGGGSGGALLSEGRTSVRPDPGSGAYMIDSFFDVWLEVSTDGGSSWTPADGPGGLMLQGASRYGEVIECWCDAAARRVTVAFSDVMDPVSLSNPDNYVFDGQPIESLRLLGDGRTVLATLAGSPTPPCDVTVSGVYEFWFSSNALRPLFWAPPVTTAIASEGRLETRATAASRLFVGQPDNPPQMVPLTGTDLFLVEVPPSGLADDLDGDGLDEAVARLLDSAFTSSDGLYRLGFSDRTLNLGTLEEAVNVVARHLDVPPFVPAAAGAMFIRNYHFSVEIDGVVSYLASPVELQGLLSGVEAAPGETLRWSSGGVFLPLEGSGGYSLGDLLLMPNVPAVALALGSGGGELTWPKPSPNMLVQRATSLVEQDWETIPPDQYEDGGEYWLYPITPIGEGEFYRLLLHEIE